MRIGMLLLELILALSTACGILESGKQETLKISDGTYARKVTTPYFELCATDGDTATQPQIKITGTTPDSLVITRQYIDVCQTAIYCIHRVLPRGFLQSMIYRDGLWRPGKLYAACDAYFPPLVLPPFGQHEETIRPFLPAGDYLLMVEYSQKKFTPPQERKTVTVFCQVK